MPTYDNTLPENRSIGRVEWYGGYDSKRDRDNKFGFLNSADHGSLFVHESGLICSPSDLVDGRWVTFRVVGTAKGRSADEVNIAENELSISGISRLLDNGDIPIETRLKVSFNIPFELGHPLIPILGKTVAEYDRKSLVSIRDFPEPWWDVDRGSQLYELLPEQVKRDWFSRKYPDINRAIEFLSSVERRVERSTGIYASMSPEDKRLALSWAPNDSDYERAKMLSARGAELASAEFFVDVGKTTLDIAMHQLTGESDHWKSHDLLLDSVAPIDVKNARSTINSTTYVEYTVKRFKRDSQGREVIIVGVLSPYRTLPQLELRFSLGGKSITILGATTQGQVRRLEQEFSQRELRVDFGDAQRWPIWIFSNDLDWFSDQREAVVEFSECVEQVGSEDWQECRWNAIPAFLIAGKEVPQSFRGQLLGWQGWYLDKIVEKSRREELTLPWLYLFTFHHFLEAITNISSAESRQYSPEGYLELIFYTEGGTRRPASLIDPLEVMEKLIDTLNILWNHRHSARLVSLRSFVFRGEGLLRGIDPMGRKVTVLAYCGGFIDGRGKCGHSPLVIGQHKTCGDCLMLICDKCGHCSKPCSEETRFDDETYN